ncbi:MAG: hypothetical protein U0694_13310 [Anaerolineae bacterium]
MLAHAFIWATAASSGSVTRSTNVRDGPRCVWAGVKGIQEAHYIIKGRNRDAAWFRVLDHEWPSVKERLEIMLYP